MEKIKDISIVTPTQSCRLENLLFLKKMILKQTFVDKIKEWIMIDGSQVYDENFEKKILKIQQDMKDLKDINLIFIPYEKNCNIGSLRNKGNDKTTGDIIVCMDDDDYYPSERVEHAYESLQKSEFLIAGCSPTLMFDFVLNKQFQFQSFGDYHSVNNAFAYKKEYLLNHRHDETVKHGEEASFTNKFSEKMVQLDPLKTVNISSHMQNTYNKRELIVNHYIGRNPLLNIVNNMVLPVNMYQEMRNIFIKTSTSTYDVIYFCGGFSVNWTPLDATLGGSEQAVKHLSENFAKKGLKVAVFGAVEDCVCNNVEYINWKKFPYHEKFKTIIVWRQSGLLSLFFKKVIAERIFWDLHDNVVNQNIYIRLYNAFISNYGKQFDKIMFKSEYHKEEYEKFFKLVLDEKQYAIIPNGLRVKEFKDIINVAPYRDPYRFVYCSCYTRGLATILKYVWPEIVALEPRAELHVYYGMTLVQDQNFRNEMAQLFATTKNVMNHDKQTLEIIAAEKCKSTFHLFLSNTQAEIDCISIRESVLCGCVPILSNFGVFKDRIGYHIDIPLNESPIFTKEMKKAGAHIGNLLHDAKIITKLKKDIKNTGLSTKKELLDDWSEIANKWMEFFFY